jgi:hypothetical protein
MSKEHTVTAGLFFTDIVNVQGLAWSKDEPKQVGLANLTRKILGAENSS